MLCVSPGHRGETERFLFSTSLDVFKMPDNLRQAVRSMLVDRRLFLRAARQMNPLPRQYGRWNAEKSTQTINVIDTISSIEPTDGNIGTDR